MVAGTRRGMIAAIILSTITQSVSCYNPRNYDDENDFIVKINDNTVEITGYKGTKSRLTIPPRIGDLPVTAIGQEAFYLVREKRFSSVKIPKGVTRIGEKAFYWNRLEELILPNTLVSIGDEAFCFNDLTGVIIPDSVKYIGVRAFWSNKLKHVKIPRNIPEIGYGAFGYNDITEIILPDHITDIGYRMFADNELTGITIPETVKTIGDYAFENNRITELIIPRGVISIGRGAFGGDVYNERTYFNDITKITIGDNVGLDSDSIRHSFPYFYDTAVKKKGGTYIYSDHYWRPEDKNIPVYIFYPEDGWKSPDIKFLLDMPDLEDIVLKSNDLLTDITPLSELKKVKKLRIDYCPNIKDIKPLSSLINLETLNLKHNNNYDYGDIAPLQKLKTLILWGDNSGEIDLGSIRQLNYLKSLTLINGLKETKIKNINKLQNLIHLEELRIVGVSDLDLSWAANLHNLVTLELDSCVINDVSPLANLPKLLEVDLTSNRIKDISPLLYSNSIKNIRVWAFEVEAGISDGLRSLFEQKGIYLDTFRDDR